MVLDEQEKLEEKCDIVLCVKCQQSIETGKSQVLDGQTLCPRCFDGTRRKEYVKLIDRLHHLLNNEAPNCVIEIDRKIDVFAKKYEIGRYFKKESEEVKQSRNLDYTKIEELGLNRITDALRLSLFTSRELLQLFLDEFILEDDEESRLPWENLEHSIDIFTQETISES